MKTHLYHTVTETILQALRSGAPPWVKPWSTIPEVYPGNALSHRPYKGIHFLLLSLIGELRGYRSNRWLTYRQAQQVGAHVRKGETAIPVIMFRVTSPTPDSVLEQEQQYNGQSP
jgi:antirestriction protein ArdC